MTDILIRGYRSEDEPALLARCLRAMQEQGRHHAWVLWTSDENADKVYGRFGFKETRRFAVLRQQL